jgi:hypothetical protein
VLRDKVVTAPASFSRAIDRRSVVTGAAPAALAIAAAGLLSAAREVNVTIGGCGG